MSFKAVMPGFDRLVIIAVAILCLPVSISLSREFYLEEQPEGSLVQEAVRNLHPTSRRSEILARRLASLTKSSMLNGTPVAHKVKPGDTISSIWARFGGSLLSAKQAESALKSLNTSAHMLRSGETLEVRLSTNGEIVGMSRELGDGRVAELDGMHTSGYMALLRTKKTVERERTVSGTISSSLVQAATSQDVPYKVIDDLVDLFSDKIEFRRDLQPGDTFSIIYTENEFEDGSVAGNGEIKAVAITNNGKLLAAVAHTGEDGKVHYYDQEGNLLGNYFLRYPLKFSRISSAFSTSRFHPVLKIHRPHNGVDFSAPTGTPVRAVADGMVELSGYNNGSGNMVKIRHDQRYSTAYLHLSKIAPGVSKSRRIARGQVIGYVGMTGLATGPHLHFSLYDRGAYVNPLTAKLPVLAANGKTIPKTQLALMLERLKTEEIKALAKVDQKSARKAA